MESRDPSMGATTGRLTPPSLATFPIRGGNDALHLSDAGFFSNAQDFTINGGHFILNQTHSYIPETISSRTAVFALLKPYTCLEATKDSSARHPPPKCHPGTREKIRDRLKEWIANECNGWRMLWVRGFAGTGKSAVAQSLADSCDEEGSLGGSYFFSRAAGRNKLKTVVPTLAYQLATSLPQYQSHLEHRLARNPSLLDCSPPIQFRKLIVEPFAVLQRERSQKPMAVILDGLDECEGEHAQREILDMITDAVRANPGLPLRWLILSRPEAHLKNAFSTNLECGRDELIIDAKCRDDVEKYVKDRLLEIKAVYNDVTPAEWPPQDKLQNLLDTVSGLFVFASTCLNYIADPDEADPDSQLEALLRFMRGLPGVVSRNPLEALDHFYSQILDHISRTVRDTTWQILAYQLYEFSFDEGFCFRSAQGLCNFLSIDQRTFYKAVRGLHSVMDIPEPEDADKSQLVFHHASFHDFLLDQIRSQKFAVNIKQGLVDIIKLSMGWYELDVRLADGRIFCDEDYCLPGLTWAMDSDQTCLSQSIMGFVLYGLFNNSTSLQLREVDENLFSTVDFGLWEAEHVFHLVRVCGLDPSTSIIRIVPSNPTDYQLLEQFNHMIQDGVANAATFPLTNDLPGGEWLREYFFIGHGAKSVLVWKTCQGGACSNDDIAYSLLADTLTM